MEITRLERNYSSFSSSSSSSNISMSLKDGILGLPNVGKSNLFNAVGLGNKFLLDIREVDSILQVMRCFEDNDIVHVNGKVVPKSDIDVINLELFSPILISLLFLLAKNMNLMNLMHRFRKGWSS